MTALCPGGGPSEPIAGTDAAVGLNGAIIAAFASSLGFPELAPVIAVATAGVVLSVDLFCAADPPSDPGLTQQDWLDAQDPGVPENYFPALGRIKDWFLNRYWHNLCQCTGGSTPPAPGPNLPTGIGVGPGLPSGGVTGACWDVTLNNALDPAGAGPSIPAGSWVDLSSQLLPVNNTTPAGPGGPGGAPINVNAIPSGISNMVLHTSTSVAPVANAINMSIFFSATPTGAPIAHLNTRILVGQTSNTQMLATVPSGALWWGTNLQNTDNATPHAVTNHFTYSCAGTGATATPCCPPDPLVDQYLVSIMGVVNQILLSQPTPVTSWAESSAHVGLTGNGSIAISGTAVAVKVSLTSIPGFIGQDLTSPTFYFDVGYLVFTTIEGSYSSQRVTFGTQVFSVPTLGFTVNYTFLNGVVATITELVRGP